MISPSFTWRMLTSSFTSTEDLNTMKTSSKASLMSFWVNGLTLTSMAENAMVCALVHWIVKQINKILEDSGCVDKA